jgi:hypothetical protein
MTSREMTPAAARPVNRSRTTAIATTLAAAAPIPCTTRRMSRTTIVGATAHSSDATTLMAIPTRSGRLRP